MLPAAPTATNNCSGSIIGASNVTFPISTAGTTVVTWMYDDENGNTFIQVDAILTANATGVTYQWLDCDKKDINWPPKLMVASLISLDVD